MRHCPLCGRGLSAKYRFDPHVRYQRKAIRRVIGRQDHPLRRIPCRWVPA